VVDFPAGHDWAMAEWQPEDDFTTIVVALMNIDARLAEVGENVIVIRTILEGDDGEEEED
jgi:hypothetical protein